MHILLHTAGRFAVCADNLVHVQVIHALRKVTDADHGIPSLPPNINDGLAAGTNAKIFQAGITVVAVGDDLDQGAQNVLADRLVRLLQGNPVSILEFAASDHSLAFHYNLSQKYQLFEG